MHEFQQPFDPFLAEDRGGTACEIWAQLLQTEPSDGVLKEKLMWRKYD